MENQEKQGGRGSLIVEDMVILISIDGRTSTQDAQD